MPSLTFIGLSNCESCKKAKAALAARYEITEIDIRKNGLDQAHVAQLVAAHPDEILNKRSTTWRQLSEEERLSDPVSLILSHPTVMKRPVILDGDRSYVGWGQSVQNALLGR